MKTDNVDILVERVSTGDDEAFKELCELKYKSVYYQANAILKNHHDAEDAVQNVLLLVYNKLNSLRDKTAFNAWLYRLITNECNMILRKKKSRKENMTYDEELDLRKEEGNDFLPEDRIENLEFKEQFAKLIGRLPADRKRAIYLYYYEDLSYKEISEVMDLGVNTVATHIKRAKEAIKKELERSSNIEVKYIDKEQNDEQRN